LTDDESEAGNLRFERSGTVCLRQLKSGNFAMYSLGGKSNPFWIGEATEIQAAYATRPPVEPYRLAPKEPAINKLGIDVNSLEIDL